MASEHLSAWGEINSGATKVKKIARAASFLRTDHDVNPPLAVHEKLIEVDYRAMKLIEALDALEEEVAEQLKKGQQEEFEELRKGYERLARDLEWAENQK